MRFSKFNQRLLVFSACISVLNLPLIGFTSLKQISVPAWICFGVFFLLTFFSMNYILRSFKKKRAHDLNMAMYLNMFIKLVVSLLVFVLLIRAFPNDKKLITLPFMLYYFLFTLFEMIIIKNVKRHDVK